MRSLLALACSLLCLVATARRAGAETLAIVELRVVGVPPAVAEQVREGLRRSLNDHGYRVVAEDVVQRKSRELGAPPGCLVGPCLARVVRALQAGRALIGGIASQGSSYDYTLTLLEGGGGELLAQVNGRCDVCNFKEVEDAVGRAAAQLHKQALVFLAAHATLTVTSNPGDAEVLVDHLATGRTPMTHILAPGRHTVEVIAKGLPSLTQVVQLSAGKARSIYVNLRDPLATIPEGEASGRRRVPTWVKWTALGGGVALTGVGAGLWALDGRATAADERRLHETKPAGVTLVSVGAALAVGAVVLHLLAGSPPATDAGADRRAARVAGWLPRIGDGLRF